MHDELYTRSSANAKCRYNTVRRYGVDYLRNSAAAPLALGFWMYSTNKCVYNPTNSITMTTQELDLRYKSIFEAHKGTKLLITRLSKVSSQPGSSYPNHQDADVSVELSAEIHQRLKEQEDDFELLKQDAEDLLVGSSWTPTTERRGGEKDSQRTALISQIERLGEDLKLYDIIREY